MKVGPKVSNVLSWFYEDLVETCPKTKPCSCSTLEALHNKSSGLVLQQKDDFRIKSELRTEDIYLKTTEAEHSGKHLPH